MSATTLPRAEAPASTRLRVIDCDIHPSPRDGAVLDRWLPERWRRHRQEYGFRLRQPFATGHPYPKATPALSRYDSWPPDGGPPGSDIDFMRRQHLDPLGIEYGMLQPLTARGMDERNPGYAEALSTAVNHWMREDWTAREPRLKATICVPGEDAAASVREIERWAGQTDFAQIAMVSRALEPLGRQRYWPIYEAAEHHGLPLGLHSLGTSGHAVTGGGWPSFYFEEHQAVAMSMAALCASFILEGVFDRFPRLKVVIIEGGFGWVPSLGWRMDGLWRSLKSEVPHLHRKPSDYLKSNIWFTTQPVEEPERPEHLRQVIDWIGWDRLLFATDYPHWDSDDPRYAFKLPMSEAERRMILAENARAVYGLS
ncbi:amidohydrolase [Belnapia sp. T6]|uniref:Amidohydrolase n=1 Tax=Belnapia mucosa TaxID=2804532 RepID=A0ABS1V0J2_9PROT|nr:amidohydrolase family protein [Belnapia mucosa]MBL6455220.1 amidohydrolase [Belnapia mucosa]